MDPTSRAGVSEIGKYEAAIVNESSNEHANEPLTTRYTKRRTNLEPTPLHATGYLPDPRSQIPDPRRPEAKTRHQEEPPIPPFWGERIALITANRCSRTTGTRHDALVTHKAFTPKMAKHHERKAHEWWSGDVRADMPSHHTLCRNASSRHSFAYGYGKWGLDDLTQSRKEGAYLDKMLDSKRHVRGSP